MRAPAAVSRLLLLILALAAVLMTGGAPVPASPTGGRRDPSTTGPRPLPGERPGGEREATAEPRWNEPARYARDRWWPGSMGPRFFGTMESDAGRNPDRLALPGGKGLLDVHDRRPRIPGALRRTAGASRPGRAEAWLVQLAPALVTGRTNDQVRRELAAAVPSLKIIEHLPAGGYLVRVDGRDAGSLEASPAFRYAVPYHPAFRIAADLGQRPLRSRDRARDPVLDLVVRLFPGESARSVEELVTARGGEVTFRGAAPGGAPVLGVRLDRMEVFSLAKLEEVRWIDERREREEFTLTTSVQTEAGRLLDPRIEGKLIRPFTEAGVDGGGIYDVDPNLGCPPFDPNSGDVAPGCFSVPPQFVGLIDNGISLDAAPLAQSRLAGCTSAGADCSGLASGTGIGPGHRKVEAYLRSWDLDGDGTPEDATAEGDFLSCDAVASGGGTHGQDVAASMLGNPSAGPFGLGFTFSDVDAPDPVGGFFNDANEAAIPMDGQAAGARLLFIDAQGNGTPVAGPPACATHLMSDVDAGALVADDVEALLYRRDLNPSATAPDPRGAKVVVLPFGTSPVYSADATDYMTPPSYSADADDLDRLLFAEREAMIVVPVGNAGHLNYMQFFDPNGNYVDAYLIQDLAAGKNTLTVGANYADSLDRSVSALTPTEIVADFSPKGPSYWLNNRWSPQVLAPGAELLPYGQSASATGARDDYFQSLAVIQSRDDDQDASGGVGTDRRQGRWGTSVSASKVGGAAAQVRDYFAQGFYPDGERGSGPSETGLSGMLVKAILTGSTDWPSGGIKGWLGCDDRPCQWKGFGKVELANILPLRSYPEARHPADGSDGPYPPGVPFSIAVVDESWNGGLQGRRLSDPNRPHPFGVIPLGETIEYRFTVEHGGASLRAALSWYDAEGTTLVNNLDLEVIDGDYDRTAGWDSAFGYPLGSGMCGSSAFAGQFTSSCGGCTIGGLENPDYAWFDPNGQSPHVRRFLGNRMIERDQFSQFASCLPGTCDLSQSLGDGICDQSPQDGSGVCDPTEHTCTASSDPFRIGWSCVNDVDCDAPNPTYHQCVAGDPNLIGTSCTVDSQCDSPNPAYQTCATGAVGAPCTSDAECSTGLNTSTYAGMRDDLNTTEMVHVYHSTGYGALSDTRGAMSEGYYKAVVSFPDRPSVIEVGAPDVPCIHAGPDGVIDAATTVGGNDHAAPASSGEAFILSGLDDPNTPAVDEARCDSTAGGDDLQLVPAGAIAQPFGLVITGAISHEGHPVRSHVDLDRADYDCSDADVVVHVTENETSTVADYTADISAGTVLEVLDAGGTVVDREGGFTFTAGTGTTGQGVFKAYEEMFHSSEPLRLHRADPGGRPPIEGNGIVEVSSGQRLRATYVDPQDPNDTASAEATISCTPALTPSLMALDLQNARQRIVAGGCDAAAFRGGRGDPYLDAGERVQYQVFFANQSGTELRNLQATLACVDPAGTSGSPCQYVRILDPGQPLGRLPVGQEGGAVWDLEILPGVASLATADRVVEMEVTFTSDNPEHGAPGALAVFNFREALQADVERLFYGTDYPAGGRALVDLNRSGTVETRDRRDGAPREELEALEFQPWAGTSNEPLLTACGGQPCVPFDFDLNDGGFQASLAAHSRPGPGFPLATQGWFHGTGGGCGWQTRGGSGGGVWHAGEGPLGSFGTGCGLYAVPADPNTAGDESTRYLLRTPVFNRVHAGLDARGLPWELRMEKLSWNANEDLADSGARLVVEIDPDVDDDGPVILGDAFAYQAPFTLAGAPGDPVAAGFRRFGPLFDPDGSLSGGTPSLTGEEIGVADPLGRYTAGNYLARPLMAFPAEDADPNTPLFDGETRVSDGSNCPPVPAGEPCRPGGFTTAAGPVRNREVDTGGFHEEAHGSGGERFQAEFAWEVREGATPASGLSIDDVALIWSEQHPGDQEGFTGGDCSLDNLAGLACAAGLCSGGPRDGLPCAAVEDCREVLAEGTCLGGLCTAGTVGDACSVDNDCDLGRCVAGNPELGCTLDGDCDLATNDCQAVGLRPATGGVQGAAAAAGPCATVSVESLFVYDCTGSVGVTVQDTTPALCGPATDVDGDGQADGCTTSPRQVIATLSSDAYPGGIAVRLTEAMAGEGWFSGEASISALESQPGILFVSAAPGGESRIQASYRDPECDQDGDGVVAELSRGDIDGDLIPDAGADGVAGDASPVIFVVGGAPASDDDSCFDPATGTDIPNPVGTAQMDLNGDGLIDAADCVVDPNHNLTGQCDWDSDGVGDICDNCPRTANHDQADLDGSGIGDACESVDIDGDGVPEDFDGNPATSNPCDPDPNGSFSACDDNCPAIYNPSQSTHPSGAGTGRGELCDRGTDYDGDGVNEQDDNCPNEGLMEDGLGGLIPGPCPGGGTGCTYNPDQTDTDGDGIGDLCDGEDYDADGVKDAVDSCPTIYNPVDPAFPFQADSDQDGRGDDRDGQDIVGICVGGPGDGRICVPAGTAADCGPGGSCAQAAGDYCDPDGPDDDFDGHEDDLVSWTSLLACSYRGGGAGALALEVGEFEIDGFLFTDDGTADFICVAGDPDPNNAPGLIEDCPVRNAGAAGDASCDTPGGGGGDGDCEPVPDGNPDPGEEISLQVIVSNLTYDAAGSPRLLENATVGIRALSPSVGCITRGRVFVGDFGGPGFITPPDFVETPPGALAFIVDPVAGQSVLADNPTRAEIGVAVTADGITASTVDGTVTLLLDKDLDLQASIPAACGTAASGSALGAAHAQPGVLCEDFDTDRNGSGQIEFTRLFPSVSPTDPLLALPDPNDDILGNTAGGGAIPLGVGGSICSSDAAFASALATCHVVPSENDWHLHSTTEGCDADDSYDGGDPQFDTRCAPLAKAHSGTRSLHMGRHLNALNTIYNTYRLRQTSAFVLDPVTLGPASTLEFWHIIRVCDDLCVGAGEGGTTAGGQIQMSLRSLDTGYYQPWERLEAVENPYGSRDQEVIVICEFDPTDDYLPPLDETMCGGQPQWSEQGDVYGSDLTCQNDTGGYGYNPNGDCGQTTNRTVDPGCDWVTDPACGSYLEHGSVGPGVWARSKFDLSPWKGREARLRWIFEGGGGWGFGESRSFLEPEPGFSPYFSYEIDEGWYVDDIRLTDLRTGAVNVVDPHDGAATCPVQGDPDNCGAIGLQISGAVTDAVTGGLVLFADHQVAGMPTLLDARSSTAGDDPNTPAPEGPCLGGTLEYRWSEVDEPTGTVEKVISSWSPQGVVEVLPPAGAVYRVEARCTSDPACQAQADLLVLAYTGEGNDIASAGTGVTVEEGYRGLFIDHDPATGGTTLSWEARPQPPGVDGWDLFRTTSVATGTDLFPGEQFLGAPFDPDGAGGLASSCDIPNGAPGSRVTFQDLTALPVGEQRFYMLSHSSLNALALAPLGDRPEGSSRAGTLVTTSTSCP